ncbi:hypothetical protein BNJ_00429 [Kaumoebavirus]|nr:hypothetical protein BNJ_00429 [Kaumoebavirus]ARA72242.1 hypothetical protein BNJ_00429 [Kaumoebavirus]
MNRAVNTTANTYRPYMEGEFPKDRQGWHWFNTESASFENDFRPY